MGLTHYWERPTELDPDAFRNAIADMKRVTASLAVRLAGRTGTGAAVFGTDAVSFNGEGATGCEPFEIHQTQFDMRGRQRFYSNVKTGGAPYDIAVKASLVCLKHHLADSVRVVSDARESDWDEARQLCADVLGYGDSFSLDK